MNTAEVVTYAITFLALYVQVFLFVTYLEKRKSLARESIEEPTLSRCPSVAIIVPCWNEEKTVDATVESLLALDYPKDKFSIVVVDDGSTDGTWEHIKRYEGHPQVRVFHKENGGKHTAVNYGIEHTDSEFVSCLDADSFVAPDALRRIMHMFETQPDLMAIAPSIIIHEPKTFIQKVQKVEYDMGIFVKKMLAYLDAIHVTPGPFSVFRRSVFERLGGFRKAHNTEDMEIAFRMQQAHMPIGHCHTAHVYTVAPSTVAKLFHQRVRWIYGFVQNTFDYRRMIFKKTYGNFSFYTLPSGVVSITATVYIFFMLLYNALIWLIDHITRWRVAGIHTGSVSFNWFYINVETIVLVSIALYAILIIVTAIGSRLGKQKMSLHIISYVVVYSIIAPFWLMKALWNTVTARKPTWR